MKFRKRLLVLVLTLIAVTGMFSTPVMAAEVESAQVEMLSRQVPSSAIYAGTIYRSGGTANIGSVSLSSTNKLYVYLPKNGNLDLFQGTITFRRGLTVVTRSIANYATDTWTFTASNIGTGTWNVTVSGYAVGTSQKCDVYFSTGP